MNGYLLHGARVTQLLWYRKQELGSSRRRHLRKPGQRPHGCPCLQSLRTLASLVLPGSPSLLEPGQVDRRPDRGVGVVAAVQVRIELRAQPLELEGRPAAEVEGQ